MKTMKNADRHSKHNEAHQLEESLWDHVEAALSRTQWSDHAAEITRRMALAEEFEPAGVVHHWARAVSRGDNREARRLAATDDDLRSPLEPTK